MQTLLSHTPWIAVLLTCATARAQQDPQPPTTLGPLELTVASNFVGRLDDRRVLNGRGDGIDDRFDLRAVDIELQAPIDNYAQGVLIIAAEQEAPGDYQVSLEEGYLHLRGLPEAGRMPMGFNLKIGRFRAGVGANNELHTHELPQVTRPYSLRTFLGDDGYIESGVTASIDLVKPREYHNVGLDVTILNGGGIAIADANDGEDPTIVARLFAYGEFSPGHELDLGVSLLHARRDMAGTLDARLLALDANYHRDRIVLGAEFYYAELDRTAAAGSTPIGGFGYAQYEFDPHWYGGVRFDYTEDLADNSTETRAVAAHISYHPSESVRIRAGWEHFDSDDPALDGLDTLMFEFSFLFGSHHAHAYWRPHEH